MLDHVGIVVHDVTSARAFYEAALAPLGYRALIEDGDDGKGNPTHVGFIAKDRASVDAFYNAAIAAGARDNGKPGLRPKYHPDYYGAFVFCPDGINVEAVCHLPE